MYSIKNDAKRGRIPWCLAGCEVVSRLPTTELCLGPLFIVGMMIGKSRQSLSGASITMVSTTHSNGVLVCVTGAGGFIGSWVVKELLLRGYHVRATARDPSKKLDTHTHCPHVTSCIHGLVDILV